MTKPKTEEQSPMPKVLIQGDHPWKNHIGRIVSATKDVLGRTGVVVQLDNGQRAMVYNADHLKKLE